MDVFERCLTLGSQAERWRDLLEDTGECDEWTLEDWLQALVEKFAKTRAQIIREAESRTQGDDESAADYMQEKISLMSQAYPGDFEVHLQLLKEGVHSKYKSEVDAVAWMFEEHKDDPGRAKKLFVKILDGIKLKTDKCERKDEVLPQDRTCSLTQVTQEKVSKQELLLLKILEALETKRSQEDKDCQPHVRHSIPNYRKECWSCHEEGHISRFCRRTREDHVKSQEETITKKPEPEIGMVKSEKRVRFAGLPDERVDPEDERQKAKTRMGHHVTGRSVWSWMHGKPRDWMRNQCYRRRHRLTLKSRTKNEKGLSR